LMPFISVFPILASFLLLFRFPLQSLSLLLSLEARLYYLETKKEKETAHPCIIIIIVMI
jgi:hypothetical protein